MHLGCDNMDKVSPVSLSAFFSFTSAQPLIAGRCDPVVAPANSLMLVLPHEILQI
jgi:hypothetical protein